jgi:hypothetical protein
MADLAEFERDLLRAQVRSGIAAAELLAAEAVATVGIRRSKSYGVLPTLTLTRD